MTGGSTHERPPWKAILSNKGALALLWERHAGHPNLLLNTLVLFGPLMVFALLKLVLPGRLRDYASAAVMWIAETWAEIDKLIFALCIPTRWDIRGGEGLRVDTSYLVVSNHQSWVAIPALIQTLNRR
ncbi:glutathionylspermidine synthase family protein, partial [Pseudomonas protegens]|uniref:glutathionylspermidine synthase family protein n=1 Tax=Pseudomonas protegens TaxID=380021 RepID=UPI001B331BE2